jgi:hypothetical protein
VQKCAVGEKRSVSAEQCVLGQSSCAVCPENSWCDPHGVVTACGYGLLSPAGSSSPSQCLCHPGYTLGENVSGLGGSVCVECPPGSFCYESKIVTCPTGTTSQPMSRDAVDCFCLPGYPMVAASLPAYPAVAGAIPGYAAAAETPASAPAIDCSLRTNATHSPCASGHARTTISAAQKTWGCGICDAGSWCDGSVEHACPGGMTAPGGSGFMNLCTCATGFTLDDCSSVLKFTVSLDTTVLAFDAGKQIIYKAALAKLLAVPVTSIVIEVLTQGAQRRLLATTIEVANSITVPVTLSLKVQESYTSTGLRTSLEAAGFVVRSVSDAVEVTSTLVPTAEADGMSQGLVIGLVAGAVLLLMVLALAVFRKKSEEDGYTQMDTDPLLPAVNPVGKDEVPAVSVLPVPAENQRMTVSLKTEGFMKQRSHMV